MITSECLAEKGDFVVCVDSSPPFSIGIYRREYQYEYESITINKKYEVLRVFGKNLNRFYSIKNDQGVKVNFSSKRFRTKTEIRDDSKYSLN
jgi:hypothetical protein